MASERVKVVTDRSGRTKRKLNLTAMHVTTDAERRRDEAVARLREGREDLIRDMAGVTPETAFAGEKWSPLTLLWHLAEPHTHLEDARRIVAGEARLPERDADAELREAIAHVVRNIDEAIAYSTRLTAEQLTARTHRGNRELYVIGFIETTVEHLFDHIDHIRQIKAREAART